MIDVVVAGDRTPCSTGSTVPPAGCTRLIEKVPSFCSWREVEPAVVKREADGGVAVRRVRAVEAHAIDRPPVETRTISASASAPARCATQM